MPPRTGSLLRSPHTLCLALGLAGCAGAPQPIARPALPAEALGYVAAAPDVLVRERTVEGIETLDCVIGLPEGADVPATLPLVVAIHGRGDGPEIPDRVYRDLHQPFRFVMPRGPLTVDDGYAWFSVRTVDGREDVLAAEVAVQADAVAQLIEALVISEPEPSRVIVSGFSQGGILTYALAVLHPEHIDVAFPIAGWLPGPLRPALVPPGGPPIFAIHGTEDEWIAVGLAETTVAVLSEAGANAELRTFPGVTHVLSDEEAVVLTTWLDHALGGEE